jgi:6-pyruvoyltetrahydropterin/6-carboxytetrahydropterin synthase
MSEYRVVVGKESLVFAAAHFITFGASGCEPLHGHNYRVGVALEGDLDRDDLVYDFVALKKDMEALLLEIDHRVLLPESNPHLTLETSGGEVEIRHATRRIVLPQSDVAFLPVSNTTAEMIAEHLGRRLIEVLSASRVGSLTRIEVEVEETRGQSAFWASPLPI